MSIGWNLGVGGCPGRQASSRRLPVPPLLRPQICAEPLAAAGCVCAVTTARASTRTTTARRRATTRAPSRRMQQRERRLASRRSRFGRPPSACAGAELVAVIQMDVDGGSADRNRHRGVLLRAGVVADCHLARRWILFDRRGWILLDRRGLRSRVGWRSRLGPAAMGLSRGGAGSSRGVVCLGG